MHPYCVLGELKKNHQQYSYTFEQIHTHATKYKDYEIVHEDNYVFFTQTSESRETHSGGNLTIMFGMQYLK